MELPGAGLDPIHPAVRERGNGSPWSRSPLLKVNNIEVIYEHVILVLKGVSLNVYEGQIASLLGANGAGKSTTLKAISNLVKAERGEVTKGTVEFDGKRIDRLYAPEVVKLGVIQIMEGRHTFEHLTVEDDLLTGAYTRGRDREGTRQSLKRVYEYFPRLQGTPLAKTGYISGGEMQMCAIGRALMAKPRIMLLDEPSMGLAPLLVEEIFSIIKRLNQEEKVGMLLAEQNAAMALEYAELRLRHGKRPGGAGRGVPRSSRTMPTSRSSTWD